MWSYFVDRSFNLAILHCSHIPINAVFEHKDPFQYYLATMGPAGLIWSFVNRLIKKYI